MTTKPKNDPNTRLAAFKIVGDLFTVTHTAFNFDAMYEVSEDLLNWANGKYVAKPKPALTQPPNYAGEDIPEPKDVVKPVKKQPTKKLKF